MEPLLLLEPCRTLIQKARILGAGLKPQLPFGTVMNISQGQLMASCFWDLGSYLCLLINSLSLFSPQVQGSREYAGQSPSVPTETLEKDRPMVNVLTVKSVGRRSK